MKRLLILPAVAALLAGCGPAPTAEQLDKSYGATLDLPPGCTYHYAGEADGDPIHIVRCDGRATTSTSTSWRVGKSTHHATTVAL